MAALAALRGEDVSWLPAAVAERLAAERLPLSAHERWLITGAGRDWPTAQEAALKLREGVYLAAEAYQLEELLHGHLAAVDESVRCFVLEGEGRAAARAADAAGALRELGCDVTLVPTRHPVVDIVPFQLLTLDLAAARGVDPDLIRWDDPRWKPRATRTLSGSVVKCEEEGQRAGKTRRAGSCACLCGEVLAVGRSKPRPAVGPPRVVGVDRAQPRRRAERSPSTMMFAWHRFVCDRSSIAAVGLMIPPATSSSLITSFRPAALEQQQLACGTCSGTARTRWRSRRVVGEAVLETTPTRGIRTF